jgi:hypothetical protein
VGTCAGLVVSAILFATPVLAQPTTEDGIRAAIRGDYSAAARILKPFADSFDKPDPIAQFFLAVLFETGKGVHADTARACGLFLRSGSRDHPFSAQAAALAANMRDLLGEGASMFCVANETWRHGPPQVIVLGPEHQITFSDTSVVIAHGDDETRTLWKLPPEAIVLPIHYTPLSVIRPLPTRRHFLQFFQWMPDESAHPSTWTLTWALSEVVGDQWLMLTYEASLAVVNSTTAPQSTDPAHFVRLQVNANGEAEFVIIAGPRPRTELIPWKATP